MTDPTDKKIPKGAVTPAVRASRAPAPANEAFDKEVDEELQREKLSHLWEQYSGYIVAGAVAVVLCVGAYKLIEGRRQAAAEAAGASYIAAIKQLGEGKVDDGTKALAALGKNSGGFATLARLRLAAADAATGKTADAVAKYDAFSRERGVDPVLADYARLQTAMLTLDTAPWEELQSKLTPLTADTIPWRHSAMELLGMAALKAGKTSEARAQFEKLISDTTVPQGIAERARIMMGSIVAADLAAKALQGAAPVTPAVIPPATPAPPPAVPAKQPAAPGPAPQKK